MNRLMAVGSSSHDFNPETTHVTGSYATIKLNGPERNAERLGLFVTWLVSNNLLDARLERQAGSAASRVRFQSLTGSGFLTTVLHGELNPEHLSDAGRNFVESYFVSGQYNADYDNCEYKGDNEWLWYDEVSPKITAAYREFNSPKKARTRTAKILQFPTRKT